MNKCTILQVKIICAHIDYVTLHANILQSVVVKNSENSIVHLDLIYYFEILQQSFTCNTKSLY